MRPAAVVEGRARGGDGARRVIGAAARHARDDDAMRRAPALDRLAVAVPPRGRRSASRVRAESASAPRSASVVSSGDRSLGVHREPSS